LPKRCAWITGRVAMKSCLRIARSQQGSVQHVSHASALQTFHAVPVPIAFYSTISECWW
jgi:hypothetical protein